MDALTPLDPDALASALLRAAPDGLLLVAPDGTILLANPAAAEVFGYPLSKLVGMTVEDLVPDERRRAHARHRERYIAHATSRPMGTELQLFAQHADGSMFPVEISLSPVEIGDEVLTIATVRDVTERQESVARVTLLQDRERIARDLHDMVIQRLFAAGMSLQAVVAAAQPPMVADRIVATIDELDDTIREIRGTIFRLGNDDVRALSAQVTELVRSRRQQLGFDPTVHIVGDLDAVPDFIAEQMVATVTEALSNIARHAGATEAFVDIELGEGQLRMSVKDDGVGIERGGRKRRGGLSNMMWRAAELGGECSIAPNEPQGTTLTWRVPV